MSNVISSKSLADVIFREKKNNGAIFTVKSLKTKKDYTYKISRTKFNDKWYTHVRCENGYLNFKYLGSYFKGKLFKKGKVINTPTAIAISFILDYVEKGKFDWLDKNMNLMHEGHCLCCGKTLTDADSIQRGLGPVCAGN
jgi:lantibiotic modifying enzyme